MKSKKLIKKKKKKKKKQIVVKVRGKFSVWRMMFFFFSQRKPIFIYECVYSLEKSQWPFFFLVLFSWGVGRCVKIKLMTLWYQNQDYIFNRIEIKYIHKQKKHEGNNKIKKENG